MHVHDDLDRGEAALFDAPTEAQLRTLVTQGDILTWSAGEAWRNLDTALQAAMRANDPVAALGISQRRQAFDLALFRSLRGLDREFREEMELPT